MAFSEFTNINSVLQKYPLKIKRKRFLPDLESELPQWFIDNINFAIENKPVNATESFLCEVFIYPFLQEAWKKHKSLQLWSHQPIFFDQELSGEPDYLISYLPDHVINHLITKPLLSVVEAKKEDFTQGWGQCLSEMIACQKLNKKNKIIIFGIVTSGELWQFGKLNSDTFTENTLPVSIDTPKKILGALDYILTECERQIGNKS